MSLHDREWIQSAKAAELLGVSRSRLRRTAAPLGIRVREFPGVRGELYHAGDIAAAIERLDKAAAERIAAAHDVSLDVPHGDAKKTPGRTVRPGAKTARTASL